MQPTKEELFQALASRHGQEMQTKLSKASAVICGLGGLGSNIAFCLARAGIGQLILADFDKVEPTNLNRQQYFIEQLGMYKTEALKETLSHINPYVNVQIHTTKITSDNLSEIVGDTNIICEAFDKADQKAMLVNAVFTQFPDRYLISGNGMAGLKSANAIQTRQVTNHFILCGDNQSDIHEDNGLFGSRVMICAAHQAFAVLQIIERGHIYE